MSYRLDKNSTFKKMIIQPDILNFRKSNLIWLILINVLISYFYLRFTHEPGGTDAPTYLNAVKYILGQPIDIAVPLNRLLTTPLMLSLTALFNFFIDDIYVSMMLINIVFYAITVAVFYDLALLVQKNKLFALLSTIFFSANYYIIAYGIALQADMGGLAFLHARIIFFSKILF